MASPCNNSPDEVVEKIVLAKANADKFDRFVNGTDTQTVQLGNGAPTPTIRNAVRQMKADGEWIKRFIADAPEGDVSLNNATALGADTSRTLAERFADAVNPKDFGAVGTGTVDDTDAIEDAAAYAAETGKPLFMPDTYLVTELILPEGTKIAGGVNFVDSGECPANSYVVSFSANSHADFIVLKMVENGNYRYGIRVKQGCSIGRIKVYAEETRCNSEAVALSGDNIYVGFLETRMINRGGCLGAYIDIVQESGQSTGVTSSGATHYKNIFLGGYFLDEMVQGLRVGRARYCRIGAGTIRGLPESVSRMPAPGNNGLYITGSDNVSFGDTTIDLALEHAVRIGGDDKASAQASQRTHDVRFGCIYTRRHGGSALKISPSVDERVYNIYVETIISEDSGIRDRDNTRRLSTLRLSHCDGFDCGDIISRYTSHSIEPSQEELFETDVVEINNSTNIDINAVSADSCGRSLICFNEANDVDANTDYSTLNCGNIDIHSVTCKKSYSGTFYTIMLYTTGMTVDDVKIQNVYMYGNFYEYVHGSDKTNLSNFFLSVYDRNGAAFITAKDGENIAISSASSKGGANIVFAKKVFDPSNAIATSSMFIGNYDNSNDSADTSGNTIVLSRVDDFKNVAGGIAARKGNVSRNCGLSLMCGSGGTGTGMLKDGWLLIGKSDAVDFMPATDSADSTNKLGGPSNRISEIFCANSTINTSDRREKDNISLPQDSLFRAWGNVRFKLFQFKDALAKKGEQARIHAGIIAQDVQEAFASEGIDAGKYGLFCFDEWEETSETKIIVDKPAVLNAEGNVLEDAAVHVERVAIPAGSRFGIRYSEALALECAYQRWLGEQRDARIADLEARLNEISNTPAQASGE